MGCIERKRGAAVRPGAACRKQFPPGELAHFARELAGAMADDGRLPAEAITAHDVDGSLEHEPSRCFSLTRSEHGLAGCETPCRAACEALGRLDLAHVEHGKHLVTTGFDEGHRCSPGGVPRIGLAPRARGRDLSHPQKTVPVLPCDN